MELKIGDKFKDYLSFVKVMCFEKDYIMLKRPKCMPFVLDKKTFFKNFKPLK